MYYILIETLYYVSTDIIVCKSKNLDLIIDDKRIQFSIPQFSNFIKKLQIIINYDKNILQLKKKHDYINNEAIYLF